MRGSGQGAQYARPQHAGTPRPLLCSLAPSTPLPLVDRTIGERNRMATRGVLAQLMELTAYTSDCAPAHAS